MKNLIITQKAGFRTTLPFTILDRFGNIFYSDEFTSQIADGKVHNFNLPKGEYKYDGYFIKLDKPVPQPEIKLPPKERNYDRGKLYKIVFAPNPNKCTIDHRKFTITFDTKFKNWYVFVLYDIYFHELGHLFYSTEQYADLFATKCMLDLGFNKTQIGLAPMLSLSSKNDFRKILKRNSLES